MHRVISGEKLILFTLIAIFLGVVSFTFFRYQLYDSGLVTASELFSGVQRSLNPSQTNVRLDQAMLVVNFKINTADQINLKAFLNNLGMDNPTNQDIKIELGSETAGFINKIATDNHLLGSNMGGINLNMKISAKEINFDNKKTFGPFESQGDLLENPSLEGSIKTQSIGENGYVVEIDNPEKVFFEATASGRLKLSEKLTDGRWWQLLSKLAKIKILIDNGSIKGAVTLK